MATLQSDLKSGKFHPIYILTGDEDFEKRHDMDSIRTAILGERLDVLNETKFLWKETSVEDIISACQTLPMMCARRVVLVQEVDSIGKEQSDSLAQYIKDPSPTTTLILVGKSIDQRLKVVSTAKKAGCVLSYKVPYANKIPAWLERHARTKNARIRPEAAELLTDIIGADLVALSEAVERLILYIGDPDNQPQITLETVEHCIARTKVHTVFELTDALGRRRTSDALRIVSTMLASKEPPIRIIAMISRHFRRLWEAQHARRSGESPDDIGRRLRIHSFFLRDFLRQCEMFRTTEYKILFHQLFEIDRKLKSSRAPADLLLQDLILSICSNPGGERQRTHNRSQPSI